MNRTEACICEFLKGENRWVTFDELYRKIPEHSDWIAFAALLEHLVESGLIQYRLLPGADVGEYKI